MAADAWRTACLHRRQNIDWHALRARQAIAGHQHQRRRSVACRTAVVELQRIADQGRCSNLLIGQCCAHLCQRVEQAIGLVLFHDR